MRRLLELLDSPATYYVGQTSRDVITAVFDVEGIPYNLFITLEYDDTNNEDVYESVVEYLDVDEVWYGEFSVANEEFGITGTGNSPIVFSTVLAILIEFMRDNQPEVLTFTGKEPSRVKLYDILARKIASEAGNYVVSPHDHEDTFGGQLYVIVRKDLV